MDPGIIREKVADIPLSNLGEIQADHEIWEVADGGAHFKVTSHRLPVPGVKANFLSLSVSEFPLERQRIIGEFTTALGKPDTLEQDFTSPNHIDFAGWLTKPEA